MTLKPDISLYELPSVGLLGLQSHYVVQHKILEPHDPVIVDDIQNNNFRTQTALQLTRHFDKEFTKIVRIIGILGTGDRCRWVSRQEMISHHSHASSRYQPEMPGTSVEIAAQ